jgi:PRTRC genetic system protein F
MTVLRIIEDRSWRTLPLFTPGTALDVARDFYWYGEEDEETALQESWGDDADAREEMRAGMVNRALFDTTFPKWALPGAGQRRPLRTRQIAEAAELAIGSAGPRIRGVIQDACALMRLRLPTRAPQAQDQEGYFIGFAGVLTWRDDDPVTPRVVDDFEQMVGESGEFFEESGTCEVDLCGPDALLRWVKDMEPWFSAVRLIDSLIFRLSDGDWSDHDKVAKDCP